MTEHTPFGGTVGRTIADSTPWWPEETAPPSGSPDVVVIVFDDVGFSDFGCYGSDIATPHIDAMAASGLRYNNFHTTALCSPTRACLLTGRNHHAAGMGVVANWDTGFPGYRGRVLPEAGTIAEILGGIGYSTHAVGKWHLTPPIETSAAGPFSDWPLQRGFDRFYGFLDGGTDQWAPELFSDNHATGTPTTAGYHLSVDLVDQSIQLLRDHLSARPDQPFFHYLSFGACHYPLQAPRDYIARYRGAYDSGWDVIRASRLQRQKDLGLVPAGTELAPPNPEVPAWTDLDDNEHALAARLQEAYAGMMEHADAQVGRLVTFLEASGRLDNTVLILLSDNGASGEGGRMGALNYSRRLRGLPSDIEDHDPAVLDEIGGPSTSVMYPAGWAQVGNTPLKRFKQHTHAGGVRDPLLISWPRGISDAGAVRTQYHHVTDIVPTLLETIGVEAPASIKGVPQLPIDGTSLVYTFSGADQPTRKEVQYYEMLGNRAIWQDGWKAVATHVPGTDFDSDTWELYREGDFAENDDLAGQFPERVEMLIARWWEEAEHNRVLPLDDRVYERFLVPRPRPLDHLHSFDYYPGPPVPASLVPMSRNGSHVLTAAVERPEGSSEGVLCSAGNRFNGWVLYVKDDRLVYDANVGGTHHVVMSRRHVPPGTSELGYALTNHGDGTGEITLRIDGRDDAALVLQRLSPAFGGGGICVGRDSSSPVGAGYGAGFAFTGRLERVHVDLVAPPGAPAEEPLD